MELWYLVDDDGQLYKVSDRLYTCDVCGKVEHWTQDWQWYGSFLLLDDRKPIFKACSEDCRKNAGGVRSALLAKTKALQ